MTQKIKVLIVDDAGFMRKAISGILESDPEVSVIGTAKNGQEALDQIRRLSPDVITLDIDMPLMDGLTAIRHIMIHCPVPIVVLSSMFSDGAVTFEALRLGVVDFVPKPSGAVSRDIQNDPQRLIDRVKIAAGIRMENIRRVRLEKNRTSRFHETRHAYRPMEFLLAIGTNLGGPNTVIRLLSRLRADLPAAIVVVQEISPRILPEFVEKFKEHTDWRVQAAVDGKKMEQGVCYLHSNESSLQIHSGGDGLPYLEIGDPDGYPLDRLFSSVADTFDAHAIGLILTGVGEDGALGFSNIRAHSGVTLAEDQQCCVYPNLTDNVSRQGLVDRVVDESALPQIIWNICSGGR